jgi:AcrR family transcriptional regulator/DNA-binding MarR family transcriptional regulator
MGAPSPPSKAAAAGRRASSANGRAPDGLSEIQRSRLLAAMVEVSAEHGARNATVAAVVARSGVSRRTFYEQFGDREECFLAAFDQAVERIARVVLLAYGRPSKWSARVRAGLTALLEYLDIEYDTARFTVVETLGAGPKALERRARVLAQVVTAVEKGRERGKAGDGPPPLTAEGLVGGALSLVHSRLLDEEGGSLVELLNPLMSMIVLPYLGAAAARKEWERPTSTTPPAGRRAGADPLRELDMRLTYRTVRVLLAIGSHPGTSNREVADAAGIRDQGQVSKLLARLEHLGLIANTRDGQAKGEPNAWKLTERGTDARAVLAMSMDAGDGATGVSRRRRGL